MIQAPAPNDEALLAHQPLVTDAEIASVLTWSNEQVCAWVKSKGLGVFEKQFKAHQITGDVLPHLCVRATA